MKKLLLCLCGVLYIGVAFGAAELADYVNAGLNEFNSNVRFRALNGDEGTNSGDFDYLGSHAGLNAGEWLYEWDDGTIVRGNATCSSTGVINNPFRSAGEIGGWVEGDSILPPDALIAGQYNDTDARYCWCQMGSYSLAGAPSKEIAGVWVFNDDYDVNNCARQCAFVCALSISDYSLFRSAVFDLLGIKEIIDLSNYCETNPDMCRDN